MEDAAVQPDLVVRGRIEELAVEEREADLVAGAEDHQIGGYPPPVREHDRVAVEAFDVGHRSDGSVYGHPRERALTAAANLEPDPTARAAVRAAVNHHYLATLRPLLDAGTAAGRLTEGTDTEALLSLLLILLPHLALAPHVQGLDPVLGMDGADADHAVASAQRLLATLLRPYRNNG